MSRQSIYENNWIDLVFENRNKEYGGYQLRQETTKTGLYSLVMGVFIIISVLTAVSIAAKYAKPIVSSIEDIVEEEIILANLTPIKNKITEPTGPKVEKLPVQQITDVIKAKNLANPLVVSASTPVDNILNNNQLATSNTSVTSGAIIGNNPTNGSIGSTGTANFPTQNTEGETLPNKEPFKIGSLDKQPEFPGGMAKFYNYVGRNFKTPEIDAVQQVRIYVSFVVEKDGSMTAIEVLNNPGYELGAEAVRVLKSIKTKWIPGLYKQQAVRTAYSLPIIIQIQ